MCQTTIKRNDKTFGIFQSAHKVILEGDIAQVGADLELQQCLKTAAENSFGELIIDLHQLSFINFAAIRSIIQFVIEQEAINFLFIFNEHKSWQKQALSTILPLGNTKLSCRSDERVPVLTA